MTTAARLGCVLAIVLGGLVAGCGASDIAEPAEDDGSVTVVAYSTAEPLYTSLISSFRRRPEGRGVAVHASFGPAGRESAGVTRSDRADVVAFTAQPAMQRLVDFGVVAPDWDANPERGIAATSTIAYAVRKGNPAQIRGWSDLLRDDVRVVLPDPRSSGIGTWALLAGYGQAEAIDGRRGAGRRYVGALLDHVAVMPATALKALDGFTAGQGDVLLVDRATASAARRDGARIEVITPDPTIRVDFVAAPTIDASSQGQAFASYLRSPDARRIYRRFGYSDTHDGGARVFTIAALGGWPAVSRQLRDRLIR